MMYHPVPLGIHVARCVTTSEASLYEVWGHAKKVKQEEERRRNIFKI
jgi:NADH:ubiquinone oxidoreductase subunit B-like Fe-S oxidoreductase